MKRRMLGNLTFSWCVEIKHQFRHKLSFDKYFLFLTDEYSKPLACITQLPSLPASSERSFSPKLTYSLVKCVRFLLCNGKHK